MLVDLEGIQFFWMDELHSCKQLAKMLFLYGEFKQKMLNLESVNALDCHSSIYFEYHNSHFGYHNFQIFYYFKGTYTFLTIQPSYVTITSNFHRYWEFSYPSCCHIMLSLVVASAFLSLLYFQLSLYLLAYSFFCIVKLSKSNICIKMEKK